MNSHTNFITEVISTVENLTTTLTAETQKLFEKTTISTGQTLEWIAANPVIQAADKLIGIDWLIPFLGKVNIEKVQRTVDEMRSQYPQETSHQIAQRLIVQKTWSGGRLGLITNIIPPIAALFLGIELIATTRLQTEMVYEIAAAYNLDLNESARRGEVLAIFALSLGADVLKTGLTVVEIIPGLGAVVGASTNAVMLYVLGQTTCRFYEGKIANADILSLQSQTNTDWQIALQQSKVMDRIVAHMLLVSYPKQDWTEVLTKIETVLPSSVETIRENLKQQHDLSILLQKLIPEFAPVTLRRCHDIAVAQGDITSEQQNILRQIADKFDLDLSILTDLNQER
jgi:uncharacterized protein (DUF697 family)